MIQALISSQKDSLKTLKGPLHPFEKVFYFEQNWVMMVL